MAKRNLYAAVRQKEDDSRLDRVTTAVRPAVVYQGHLGNDDHEPDYRIVLASGFSRRQPRGEVNEFAKLQRELKAFEPQIYSAPKDKKWCRACGEWVNIKLFSARSDAADKLQPVCFECRNAYARHVYASSLDREVRSYKRAA